MNSLKLSILQDGVCLAWLLLDYYCSFHFPAVVRFNDCISTTRRNDISVVNVRRTSSSSSCKNCNCYNLNLQREFPFHAPSLFSKSWKASRILQYEPKINLKLFLPFPFNIRSLPSWGVYQNLTNLRSRGSKLRSNIAGGQPKLLENHMHEKSAF